MPTCTYVSDLNRFFHIAPAAYRQALEAVGRENYFIEDICPSEIFREFDFNPKLNPCLIPIQSRYLYIWDDRGGEWIFTIPFAPYTDKWDLLFTSSLQKDDRIKAYRIKGEIVKYSELIRVYGFI